MSSVRKNFQRILLISSASMGLGGGSLSPQQVLASSAQALNTDAAKALTTLKGDAHALISDQQGLMASLSIEGTKISQIKR